MSSRPRTMGLLAALVLAALLTGCGTLGDRHATAPLTTPAPSTFPTPRPVVHHDAAPAAFPPLRPVSPKLITHGPRDRKVVALTFDADMTSEMRAALQNGTQKTWIDHALFDLLHRTRTPATIFLTGMWTNYYKGFVKGLARQPRMFELENHSYDHLAWTSDCYGLPTVDTTAGKKAEVRETVRTVEKVAGVQTKYFRWPGGCHRPGDLKLAARQGQKPLEWDVVSGDPGNSDTRAIVDQVLNGVKPGSIVIAHCIGAPNTPRTAAAMAQIIPALRARGYRFVTLDQMLGT